MSTQMPPLNFLALGGRLRITVSDGVIRHVLSHRQVTPRSTESGGQLFAEIGDMAWQIKRATGPRKTDWRSRFGYRPDRRAEQQEINSCFAEGLHYVGDWHTHPETDPAPSHQDLESMERMTMASKHQLPGFLMLIIGTSELPNKIWVSFHSKEQTWARCHLIENPLPTDGTTESDC